jgi:hypothetical protein
MPTIVCWLRSRLTYANVIATVALFLALGPDRTPGPPTLSWRSSLGTWSTTDTTIIALRLASASNSKVSG